jgi:hypothetical protein
MYPTIVTEETIVNTNKNSFTFTEDFI